MTENISCGRNIQWGRLYHLGNEIFFVQEIFPVARNIFEQEVFSGAENVSRGRHIFTIYLVYYEIYNNKKVLLQEINKHKS